MSETSEITLKEYEITPEIDRAITFFNYCFPQFRIFTAFSLNKNCLIARSSDNKVDYNVSLIPNTLDEMYELNASVRRIYRRGLKTHLRNISQDRV